MLLALGSMLLLGAGLTAAGMLWSGLYDIGILLLILAGVGVLVGVGDRLANRLGSGRGDGGPV